MLEIAVSTPCPECGGSGKIVLFTSIKPCPKCEGTGKVEAAESWPPRGWEIKGGG